MTEIKDPTHPGFEIELERLINRYSKESDSNTPDFILAAYLTECLSIGNRLICQREMFYGRG